MNLKNFNTKNPSGPKTVIGVSFGTMYCSIAAYHKGVPVSIPDPKGDKVFPSLIYILPDGKVIFGQHARRLQILHPREIISGEWIMRFSERKYSNQEITEIQKNIPVGIVAGQEGNILFEINRKPYKMSIVCSLMLNELKNIAENFLNKKVDEIIISIPDCFYKNSGIFVDSGHQAGFETIKVISRSEAVIKNFARFKSNDSIAVCDLSENIFNISVCKISSDFDIDAIRSDDFLGEDKIVENLIKWVIDDIKKQSGIDLNNDRLAIARIKEAVIRVRLELALKPEREFIPGDFLLKLGTIYKNSPDALEIVLPYIYKDFHYRGLLSHKDIQQIISNIKQQTIKLMQKTMEMEKLRSDPIGEVIILGEKSTISELNSIIKTYWNLDPLCIPEPHETIAKGAFLCSKNRRDVLTLDVTPLSLGVETMRGMMMKIIPRNTIMPATKSLIFSTEEDNQTSVSIHVCQGEFPMAADNITLGKFYIEGIAERTSGLPRIEITFDIDISGVINVTARDLATGKEQKITVSASYNQPKADTFKTDDKKTDVDLFSVEHVASILLDDIFYELSSRRKSFAASEETKNETAEIYKRFKVKNICEGGMGRVYIVSTSGYPALAIKTYKNEFIHDRDAVGRFVREASTWIKLGRHTNIVTAYSIQKISGKPCVFLEYISGGTLQNHILSNTLGVPKALNFSLQICEGMNFAYNKLSIVHRDLKPANILITDNGIVKITDFGLVKALDYLPVDMEVKEGESDSVFLSKVGIVAGTPAYMSPEQFRTPGFVDTRSDIYSFGVMFYEMLTGRLPFKTNNFMEYESKHLDEKPFNPTLLNHKIPEYVSFVVMKCLQKYPEKRYQTFSELKTDLKRAYEKTGGHFPEILNTGLSTAHDLTLDGFLLLNLNNYIEATAYFDNAIDLDSGYGLAWAGKGVSLLKAGKNDGAINCFHKTLEINPDIKIVQKIKRLCEINQ
jgi:molecular chaperone DnaK